MHLHELPTHFLHPKQHHNRLTYNSSGRVTTTPSGEAWIFDSTKCQAGAALLSLGQKSRTPSLCDPRNLHGNR